MINKVEFVAPFRETEHSFRAEAHQCRHCDAISTTPEQVTAISAKARDEHKAWISGKFKKAQKELGLSIRDLAASISIPQATLARISSGESLIEATLEKLLWKEIQSLREAQVAVSWMQMSAVSAGISSENSIVTLRQIESSTRPSYCHLLQTAAQSPLSYADENKAEEPFFAGKGEFLCA